MRRSPTRGEDRLWNWLRNRRFAGYKFRRQVPIGHYVADFYCAGLKIAIELDGEHHKTPWMSEYDNNRTSELERRGIYVVRITNVMLIRDSQLVAECIQEAIARIIKSKSE